MSSPRTPETCVVAPIETEARAAEFAARVGGESAEVIQAAGDAVRAEMRTTASAVFDFLGEKNFALFVAAAIAGFVLKRQRGYTLGRLAQALEPAFISAGVIILITSAGGAFGTAIKATGIGDAIGMWVGEAGSGGDAQQAVGITLLLISFGIAVTMKVAQGSGTVSMITTAGIMAPIIDGVGGHEALPYHIIYIFSAIAFGSMVISWMNDSGFWVVSKMSGFTEKEALKTWTLQLGLMGVLGIIEVLILSQLLPLTAP